ncbi:MAG TPA: kelch repeat-containing protein [Acidimicrobiales bacterium]|nr:kelch repeat-containing protein [Acidimicrobiales bacterium]
MTLARPQLALFCAAMLATGVLVACGGKGNDLDAGPPTSRRARFPAAVVSTTTPSTTPFGEPLRPSVTATTLTAPTATTSGAPTATSVVAGRKKPAETPLPVARTSHAGVAWQGLVVIAGGVGAGGGPSVRVDAFDPKTGLWSRGPNLPVPLRDAALAVLGDDLWVVGGFTAEEGQPVAQSATYFFRPGDDAWQTGPALHTARGGVAAATLGNFLVALGGETTDATVLDSVEVLARGSSSWRVTQPLSQARSFATALAMNDRIYAVGGKTALSPSSNTVESWRSGSTVWRSESRLDKERARAAGAASCVAGGQNDEGVATTIECFGTGFWVTHAQMRVARFGLAVVALDGWLHLIGGSTAGTAVTNVHEVIDIAS